MTERIATDVKAIAKWSVLHVMVKVILEIR